MDSSPVSRIGYGGGELSVEEDAFQRIALCLLEWGPLRRGILCLDVLGIIVTFSESTRMISVDPRGLLLKEPTRLSQCLSCVG